METGALPVCPCGLGAEGAKARHVAPLAALGQGAKRGCNPGMAGSLRDVHDPPAPFCPAGLLRIVADVTPFPALPC